MRFLNLLGSVLLASSALFATLAVADDDSDDYALLEQLAEIAANNSLADLANSNPSKRDDDDKTCTRRNMVVRKEW
jgi:hypothetical protein